MAQPEFIVHGDAEAAVIDILKNMTPELDFATGHPVVQADLQGYTVGARFIMVTKEGSIEEWPAIDRPRIDVEVYAERRSMAHDIAAISLASIKYQMGRYYGYGLFISDVKLEQGLTRVPDKLEEAPRYIFAVRLTTRPYGSLAPLS